MQPGRRRQIRSNIRSENTVAKGVLKILVALIVAIYVVSVINALLSYRIERWTGIYAGKYFEYSGVINIQTQYSTGTATYFQIEKMCDSHSLDFAIFTDVNSIRPMDKGYSHRYGMTLVVPAIEIVSKDKHERFLVIGDSIPILPGNGVSIDSAVNYAVSKRDLVFLAQPITQSVFSNVVTDKITGMELYNFDQAWRRSLTFFQINKFLGAYSVYGFNTKALNYLLAYPNRSMKYFDQLNQRQKAVGIGSIGANNNTSIGKRSGWHFPNYESLLPLVHTVIVTKVPFNAVYQHDRRILIEALKNGNDYVAFSGLEHGRGFLFTARSDTNEVVMGDSLRLWGDAVLNVIVPDTDNVETQVVRDGKVIATYNDKSDINLPIRDPGQYRVQVFQKRTLLPFFNKRKFPWILSNPIYIFK